MSLSLCVFCSLPPSPRAQETTQVSSMIPMIALGMLVVGVPNSEQRLFDLSEAEGGSAFGASTIAGGDGSRQPLELELGIANSQGAHVAKLADALRKGKE